MAGAFAELLEAVAGFPVVLYFVGIAVGLCVALEVSVVAGQLDFDQRRPLAGAGALDGGAGSPVSYTHLDVYKRQGYYSDTANTKAYSIKAYTLTDARASYRFNDQVQLYGYVKNVFDDRSPTYMPVSYTHLDPGGLAGARIGVGVDEHARHAEALAGQGLGACGQGRVARRAYLGGLGDRHPGLHAPEVAAGIGIVGDHYVDVYKRQVLA